MRQQAGVQPKGDSCNAGQHRNAETLADAVANAEEAFHRREHACAGKDSERQRGRGTCGISNKQQRRLHIRAVQRRAGQHQAEHRSGAGCPEQSGRNTEQDGAADAALLPGRSLSRQPVSQRHERASHDSCGTR
ncbi:hypothetical protein D9M72_449540 [compost metagenome]